MKEKIKILFFVLFPFFLVGYPWPVEDFNQQHSITGTLGEYRTTHFHGGVDIAVPANTPIYPVVSGRVIEFSDGGQNGGYVRVRGGDGREYDYVHIQRNLELNINDSVIQGQTLLGWIAQMDYPHLHFEEEDGNFNPLRQGGLTPYEDTGFPSVWASPDFMLYRQGTNNQLPLNQPIWGLVDILVRARDRQSLGSENTGIYRIGYQITDLQNKVLLPYTEGIRFDDINGNVGLVYDIARSTNSIFYYWVTNSKNENRYWNTKLRRNEPWNGVDARINSEAQTPDGRVRVWVLAYDIMGNSGSNNEEIILDNFAPYLEHLVIFNSKIYQAEWQGPIDDTLHLRVYSRDEFKQNELNNLKIILLFSEHMNTNYNPQISAYFEKTNRTYNLNINGNWIDNDLFDGNLFFPNLNDDDTGKVILRISGVQDVAGNGLDINPKTIAGRKLIKFV